MDGLSEWLRGNIPTTDIIHQVECLNFWLLPAGEPLSEPLELMQSDGLAALMNKLSESFDWIIIDSTPILPVADTNIWARLTQGILMVVREGKTGRRQLQKALDGLDVSTLLGVVVNGSSKNAHESYYMYYSTAHGNGIREQES
jgi:Mrp family chromosome partitioning ATPase